MLVEDLIPIWEEDMQKLIPDFQLLQDDLMQRAIQEMRELLERLKIRGPNATSLQVCVDVLRNGLEEKINIPPAWWWITTSLFIMDDIVSNPWYEVCWWTYERSRGKRETNTLWGAANCGKTEFFGALAWTNMVVWSNEAYIYVTSPWKTHGSDKIWGSLYKRARRWETVNPQWLGEMDLRLRVVQDEITLTDVEGKEASARFVSLDSSAAVTGKKRNKTDDLLKINPRQGVMLLISDELVENPEACAQFAEAESNYISNPNAMGFIAFNPKPHKVQHTNAIGFSAPIEVPAESLMRDTDFTWKTKHGTLVRLCMANSPNAPCGDDPIFPFLINKPQADAQMRRGEMAQAAQVDAWGWGEGDNGSELTHHDCIREDRQSPPVWIAPPVRALFMDPAFGGRDAMSYTCGEIGVALVDNSRQHVISIVEQGINHITRKFVPTELDVQDFKRLAASRGGKMPDDIVAGKECSTSYLVALMTLRTGARLNIPMGNITYDGSQRVDAGLPMNAALGRVLWYYEGSRKLPLEEGPTWKRYPTIKNQDGTTRKWSDEVSRPISMIWRFAERVISRGKVLGLRAGQRGLTELRSRRWVTTGGTGRTDVEAKENLLVSPTYGEGIATMIYFAVRYLGALPDLFSETPESGNVIRFSDPLFQTRARRIDSRLWKT